MMYKLETHLDLLEQALRAGKTVQMPTLDSFVIKGWLNTKIRKFLGGGEVSLYLFTQKYIEHLDQLERIPIYFGMHGETASQAVNFPGYLAIANLLLHKTRDFSQRNQLHRRILAIHYRLSEANGGINPTALQPDITNDLFKAANLWKQGQPALLDKAIRDRDVRKLELTSCFPEFAELVLQDADLQNEFFTWVLRDQNGVEPFVLFPALQRKMVINNLNGRIGRLGGRHLTIRRVPTQAGQLQQIVTLPFEGRIFNILDEAAIVELRGNYQLPIRSVYEVFKNKEFNVGNLEFFADGILNWNSHFYGHYDAKENRIIPIDLEQPGWWKQLPIFEVLTKEQAQTRYGWHLDGKSWNAAATASRGTPTLNYEESHAYLEIAIPIGNGNYAVYDFGKFSYKFPENEVDKLSMFADNLHATIAYPDENVFYTQRQHANHSFCLTPEQGFRLMESIKEDLIQANAGNMVYQIESDNCAKWLNDTIEKVIGDRRMPNLFQFPLLHAEPKGFMALAFRLIKKLPEKWQVPVFMFCHLPFAPFRGRWVEEEGKRVFKSLMNHQFWQTGVVYLPAYLHHQKQNSAPVYSQPSNNQPHADPVPGWIQQIGASLVGTNHTPSLAPHYAYARSSSPRQKEVLNL